MNNRNSVASQEESQQVSFEIDANNSVQSSSYNFELDTQSHIKIKVESNQLNKTAVTYNIASKISQQIFGLKINIMDISQLNVECFTKALLEPLAETLRYDINDNSTLKSNFIGYFMAIMYMSLPYYKCFHRRNWWDILHHITKDQIIFIANAANWYYRAYYDICRELWYSIGPIIGSKLPLSEARNRLIKNLNSNLQTKQSGKVTYKQAYEFKDAYIEKINIASAVNYIISTHIDYQTVNVVNESISSTINSQAAILQNVELPRLEDPNYLLLAKTNSSQNMDSPQLKTMSYKILINRK